jgi:hypothetical protein
MVSPEMSLFFVGSYSAYAGTGYFILAWDSFFGLPLLFIVDSNSNSLHILNCHVVSPEGVCLFTLMRSCGIIVCRIFLIYDKIIKFLYRAVRGCLPASTHIKLLDMMVAIIT